MEILKHKLAWRWTDHRYAILPDFILNEMHTTSDMEAKEVFKRAISFLGKESLSNDFIEQRFETKEQSASDSASWLMMQQPDESLAVILSWDTDVAIQTTWKIFVEYWQEFCYPASDDLVVFPQHAEWVLFYHHSEAFYFGRRRVNV